MLYKSVRQQLTLKHPRLYSSIIDNKVCDWTWKKRKVDTVFYIGDKYIGQLFSSNKRKTWSAVHRLPSTTGGPVCGFSSRLDASAYLDQIERMYREIDEKNKAPQET